MNTVWIKRWLPSSRHVCVRSMSGSFLAGLALLVMVSQVGCASNALVGDRTVRTGKYYGDVGVTGHLNKLTVEPESRLRKLSIIGNGNEVAVANDVRIREIEVWGQNNTISLPEELVVRLAQVSRGTRFIRRPHGAPLWTGLPSFAPRGDEDWPPPGSLMMEPPMDTQQPTDASQPSGGHGEPHTPAGRPDGQPQPGSTAPGSSAPGASAPGSSTPGSSTPGSTLPSGAPSGHEEGGSVG